MAFLRPVAEIAAGAAARSASARAAAPAARVALMGAGSAGAAAASRASAVATQQMRGHRGAHSDVGASASRFQSPAARYAAPAQPAKPAVSSRPQIEAFTFKSNHSLDELQNAKLSDTGAWVQRENHLFGDYLFCEERETASRVRVFQSTKDGFVVDIYNGSEKVTVADFKATVTRVMAAFERLDVTELQKTAHHFY